MSPLPVDLRNKLERVIIEARRVAETGARAALEAFAVGHHEPFGHMSVEQRKRRTQLRARARQLGDQQDKNGRLELTHIGHECAYEHWHRMLFARFLAENGLLIEPDSGVAISLEECKELAKDAGTDLWSLAGRYAQRMLPQIFRPDDPLLQIILAKEHLLDLELKLDSLSLGVFTASDSLGWCYQFWQAEKKDQVNASGEKIGADELPAVTQLFTEDYMVDFLLDNTLGAWWAGKQLAAKNGLLAKAKTEDDCRRLVALPGCPWKYLRFVKDDETGWRSAAGTFEGWPKTAKELKCLDPCMGSGHFEVTMFERLVALRMADERLNEKDAVAAVIRDNLFGLEIDPRCTQIAAFNLALAAWRRTGHCALPAMNLACSGLAPNSTKEDWLKLAGNSEKLQRGMERLFDLFHNAPLFGSLINPHAGGGDLLMAAFHELQPLLKKSLIQERDYDVVHELAVTVNGLVRAANILGRQFTLVGTNVPYLTRGKQDDVLKEFVEEHFPLGKGDLATAFLQRCLDFCLPGSTCGLVTPQNWLFLGMYKTLRMSLLRDVQLTWVLKFGEGAFQSSKAAGAFVAMVALTKERPKQGHLFSGLDVSEGRTPNEKAKKIIEDDLAAINQAALSRNPDAIISFHIHEQGSLLSEFATINYGSKPGQTERVTRFFWEVSVIDGRFWVRMESTPDGHGLFSGKQKICLSIDEVKAQEIKEFGIRSEDVWGKRGITVSQMRQMPIALYLGNIFDNNTSVILPKKPEHLLPIVAFIESGEYLREIRKLNQKMDVAANTMVKVPFTPKRWENVAAEKYPNGIPEPYSNDPTQWVFKGTILDSTTPLQVAVALMLDYVWPEQSAKELSQLKDDSDLDGIVCIASVRGDEPAAERLRRVLAKAYGKAWTPTKERELIVGSGSAAADLDEWLRNDFFQQHYDLFHQRPFIWHIWDGRKRDGFHVLVNYHKLADGAKGRKLLEKLTHAYLNDWIGRQRDGVKREEGGAEERLAAAEELKTRLEAIIEGEPPFDIFVRWKPLHQQPIGWEPDVNDGVCLNIRPFLASDIPGGKKGSGILRGKPNIKWDKDRGKEPARPKAEFPWFWKWDEATKNFMGGREFDGNRWNDCHYSNETKHKARNMFASKDSASRTGGSK